VGWRDRREAAVGCLDEAPHDERGHGQQEQIGGEGEKVARLAHSSEVPRQEQGDYEHPEQHRVGPQAGDGGGDGGDPRGHRYGNGQDVVDDQTRGGRQTGDLPEVVGGHDVRPGTGRVGADGLPVGHADADDQ
jgi:hypothetical protein